MKHEIFRIQNKNPSIQCYIMVLFTMPVYRLHGRIININSWSLYVPIKDDVTTPYIDRRDESADGGDNEDIS